MGLTSSTISSNGSLAVSDVSSELRKIINSVGVRVQIPAANETTAAAVSSFRVLNESDGFGSLWRDDAFGTDNDTLLIPPREEIEMECISLTDGDYRWGARNRARPSEVKSCTPTPTWTTHDATVTSNTMWYSIVECGSAKGFFFHGRVVVSDGKDAAGLTLAFPAGVIPEKRTDRASTPVGCLVPIDMRVKVDSTWTDAIGYVDIGNATAETRAKIQHAASITFTDTKACEIYYSGFVPLSGWQEFDPIFAYAVGTATMSDGGWYMPLGPNTVAVIAQATTADSDTESAITFTPPLLPQDMDIYGSCKAIEVAGAGGATYSNPDPSCDFANDTAASRSISNLELTTATDGQAFKWYVAAIIPVRNWQEFDVSSTTSPDNVTYTTDDPEGTLVEAGYYDAYDNMVFITAYISFTDGNGCTGVEIDTLPIPPRAACGKIALPCTQVQHSDTWENCMAYIDSDDADPDDRAIQNEDLTTWDDGEVGKYQVTGFYFV